IEITQPDWLSILAHQAMREDVGAVGARLLYPTGLIQHAGVVTGIGGAAAHAHRGLHPDEEGYFHRHRLPQFASAVTAACMVISREKFDAVGGFDAERFAVSFNDVDLCLRLREKGWHTVYEPRATLVHHESVSRGFDRDPAGAARQARETRALQERWHTGFASSEEKPKSADPYHHPGLSPLSERFALRL
ncbi:MAG: glycosyltransferase, partial [Pseudomonadota bacterium]